MREDKNGTKNLKNSQPSSPSRQTGAGVVGDPVLAESVDASV